MSTFYDDPHELGKAIKNGEDTIIVEGNLKDRVLRIKATGNYDENLFLRTVEGNPMIDRAYKMVLAAA